MPRGELERLAQDAVRRGADSPDSRAVLELSLDASTPWGVVEWLLQVGSFPARIHHIRFAILGDSAAPVANDLPVDGSIGSAPEPERVFRVTLWRTAEEPGRTRARVTLIDYKPHYGHFETGQSRACEPGYGGIRAGLAGFGADQLGFDGLIVVSVILLAIAVVPLRQLRASEHIVDAHGRSGRDKGP